MKLPSKDWYRSRKYLHFDLPIKYKKASKVVLSPDLVAKHAFYPMIRYSMEVFKISKDPITKKITKPKNTAPKTRIINYPAHLDSHIYSYYSKVLSRYYEKKLKDNDLDGSVTAFRSIDKKSNIDFSLNAFNEIKKFGDCCAVALDVTKFFDTLDHDLLKKEWCDLLRINKLPNDHFNIFKSITKYYYVEKTNLYNLLGLSLNYDRRKSSSSNNVSKRRVCSAQEFRHKVRGSKLILPHKGNCGIPQGTPLSAMLSNMYMFEFDRKMNEYVKEFDGKYFRYCDDMLFIVPIEKKHEIENYATTEIKNLKLSVNKSKTAKVTFTLSGNRLISDKPLQYLGFEFCGEDIFIRSSSLSRYSGKMRKGVRLAKKTMLKYNNVRISNGKVEKDLFKKKLYSRYTHLGKRNFITYGIRAAKKMNSKSIRKQLSPLLNRFDNEINKK